jgi:hypothetical protein
MKKRTLLVFSALSTLVLAGDNGFNDPLFSKQWAMKNSGQIILKNISDLDRIKVQGIPGTDINWIDTGALPTPKKELIVAVLDSGLDLDHPDLKGRIWFNELLCTNAPNVKNLPCYGYNYLDGNTNLEDDVGHGTHVAGIIAANRNTIGIAGAADPRIKIMPVKVLNSQVSGFVYNGKLITDVIADAMIFAIKNGAEVINLSLGWPKLIDTAKVRQAFQMAEDNNVLVIAASGNNTKDLPTYPCSYENVVCVGAIDNRGELAEFSNYGAKVDVVAPGEYIVSTIPRKLESRTLRIANYDVKRGSSQAAPYVTAAVATLKLINPGLSNDKVRSLLFQSTNSVTSTKNRSVKFGALDFKKLLMNAQSPEEKAFLNPQMKAITEIKYKNIDRRFSFNLPLKNLSDLIYNGTVCLSTDSDAVALDQSCFNIKEVKAHSTDFIAVKGTLLDLNKDSHIKFKVQTGDRTFEAVFVFSRDLNDDSTLQSSVISGGSFEDMAVITQDRRLSRMIRVMDKYHRLSYPEYFFLERAKQNPTSTVVSLLTKDHSNFLVKTINLPLVNRVLSIHRQDLNMDGELDYFIYTLSAKKDELIFFCLDKNLNPLFGKYSKWSFPLSTFEGLPIDGGQEKFEWLKLNNSKLGAILVPSVFKAYAMPEADNSKNILDRVTTAENHHYYLNPVIQSDDSVKIELRVIDNVIAKKKMRRDFKLYEDQAIGLIKPFPQTEAQSSKGEIHSLAWLNDGVRNSFLELSLTQEEIQAKPISSASDLEIAMIYPVLKTDDGKISGEAIFTSLLSRASAEFIVKSGSAVASPLVLKQDWENPVIGLIGAFGTILNEKSFLVENRSSISYLRADGSRSDLPIYRDSSFPGQNFSETLMPILAEKRPGVFINSTLIYGERLYSMIGIDSRLVRPLYLSVNIPQGCVPLNPETLDDRSTYNYGFLCVDQKREVTLKFLPMVAQ